MRRKGEKEEEEGERWMKRSKGLGIQDYGKEGNGKGQRGDRFEDGSLFLESWTTETPNSKSWTNVVAE